MEDLVNNNCIRREQMQPFALPFFCFLPYFIAKSASLRLLGPVSVLLIHAFEAFSLKPVCNLSTEQ